MSYFLSQYQNVTLPLAGKAYSSILKVVVQHTPPLVYVDGAKTGQARYSGAFIDLLPTLLNYAGVLNKTVTGWTVYDVTAPPSSVAANASIISASTIVGSQAIIDELNSGRADLSLYPTPVTSSTSSYLDVTSPIVDTGQAIMVKTDPQTLGPEVFLLPFDGNLWATLMLTMFAMSIVLMVLDRFALLGRWKDPAEERLKEARRQDVEPLSPSLPVSRANSGLPATPAPARPKSRSTHLFETWLCFTQNVKVPRGGAWSVQLVYVILCLFCFVIFQAYQAQLNSLLTTTRAASNINSLTDLYSGNYAFGVVSGSVAQSYFLTSTDFLAVSMRTNMLVCDDMNACVDKLRSGNISAVLNYRMLLQAYIASNSACDLGIVGSDFTPGNFALGLPRNSSLTWKLNIGIQQARDSGKAAAIYRTWLTSPQCGHDETGAGSFALDLQQVLYPYLVLITVIGMALVWILFDVVLLAVLLRYPNLRRYNPALLWRRYTRRRITSLPGNVSMSGAGAPESPFVQPPYRPSLKGTAQYNSAATPVSPSLKHMGSGALNTTAGPKGGKEVSIGGPSLLISAFVTPSVSGVGSGSGSSGLSGAAEEEVAQGWTKGAVRPQPPSEPPSPPIPAAAPVAEAKALGRGGSSVNFSDDPTADPASLSHAQGATPADSNMSTSTAHPSHSGSGATEDTAISPVLPFTDHAGNLVPQPPTAPPPPGITPSPRAASLLPGLSAAEEGSPGPDPVPSAQRSEQVLVLDEVHG